MSDIDDGSDKPLGYRTDDDELEVRDTGNGPEYHETDLGQHQRWVRQAPDLYEKYMAAVETIASLRAGPVDDPAVSASTGLSFDDALRIARGCLDYGGGHRSNDGHLDIYHHGVQTVINALTAATERGLDDSQVRALHSIGSHPADPHP